MPAKRLREKMGSQATAEDPDLERAPSPSQWKPRMPLPGCNQGVLIGTSPEERGSCRRKAFPSSSQTGGHPTAAEPAVVSAALVGWGQHSASPPGGYGFFPLMEILLKGKLQPWLA